MGDSARVNSQLHLDSRSPNFLHIFFKKLWQVSKMTSLMVKVGKGQVLRSLTRAVPLMSVADHNAPQNSASPSIAVAKSVLETKGHAMSEADFEFDGGHLVYHDMTNFATYKLMVVNKPKAHSHKSLSSGRIGAPAAINGIGV